MLKLIIDENIAFVNTAFNQFGNVTLLPGREISNSVLKDADVLIVRSITKVNEKLLENTPVKFVGTATIGTDHIDIDFLKKNNIAFADAKGCNAYSVAEYVIASLLNLSIKFDFSLKDKSIGIIGVGNVGSKVTAFAEALGMKVLLNDPPLQRQHVNSQKVISKESSTEKSVKGIRLLPSVEVTNEIKKESLQKNNYERSYVKLEKILSADIITLHVPLNLMGIDKTYHLFDKEKLSKIKDKTILLNTSRGSVINNAELLDVIEKKKLKVVLDVWENESDINVELLNKVLIGTPHIAGYSFEGKVNGTQMIYNSLCEFLDVDKIFLFKKEVPQNSLKSFEESRNIETGLEKLISSIYPINDDDERMRKMLTMNGDEQIKYFDLQRKNYPKRREFNNYNVESKKMKDEIKNILTKLRFYLT